MLAQCRLRGKKEALSLLSYWGTKLETLTACVQIVAQITEGEGFDYLDAPPGAFSTCLANPWSFI
jgi:hypothetical protein